MNNKKSWLYKGTAIATILTLIGIWSHLATAFSAYEVREANSQAFEWSIPGMIIASSIGLFLILTAIGITVLEKRIEKSDKSARKQAQLWLDKIKTLNRFLIFFAFIEMYGNIYYSMSAIINKPRFNVQDIIDHIDPVAGTSLFMFSFTLTLISIVGSKLLSIFAVNETEESKQLEIVKQVIKLGSVEESKPQTEIQPEPTQHDAVAEFSEALGDKPSSKLPAQDTYFK